MLVLHCSACGHRFEVPEGAEGGEPRCPVCGRPSIAPAPPAPPQDAATLTHFPAPTPRESAPPRLPSVPGYEVLEEVGRGGMGVVYKARQTFPRRVVALKMILGDFGGADRLARFRAEVAAAARVPHPNVVQVHEVGEHNGRPFFSMEYVGGGTLAQFLDGRPLPPDDAAALVEQLGRAVQHAHERGVVHRDLNPRNVLMALGHDSGAAAGPRLGNRVPKITDFGIAKHLEGASSVAGAPRTTSGAILGTPAYMAPEQAGGKTKAVGPAADVYALGAILSECLTGRPPFIAPTALETLMKVVREEPMSPRQQRREVPRDLDVICLKCLRKDPAGRYASARDLADDLRRFRNGESIKARPQSVLERAGRWVLRRRELAYVAAGALLVAVLGAAGLLLWPGPIAVTPTGREPTPAELPADLALVPESALGFVTVRAAELWPLPELRDITREQGGSPGPPRPTLDELGRDLELRLGLHPRDLERVTFVLDERARFQMTVLFAARPLTPNQLSTTLATRGRHLPETHKGRTIYRPLDADGLALIPIDDRTVVAVPPALAREVASRPVNAEAEKPLGPALLRAAAGQHALVAGLRPSQEFLAQQFARLQIPHDADAVGKVRSAVITVNVRPLNAEKVDRVLAVEGLLEYADDARAEAALPHVPAVVGMLARELQRGEALFLPAESVTELLAPVQSAAWERDGARLRAAAKVDWKPADIIAQAREVGERRQSADNLRRIGTALRAYQRRHGRFPPAVVTDEDGKPLFSWRVLVLPYLGGETVYRRFHLNRPWDYPANAALLGSMPRVFASPRPGDAPGMTRYQVVTGPGGIFDDSEGTDPKEIKDGLSRTLLVTEGPTAVPWTKPDDLVATPEAMPRLGGLFASGFNAVTADGNVRFMPAATPAETLRALFTRAGGEPDAAP